MILAGGVAAALPETSARRPGALASLTPRLEASREHDNPLSKRNARALAEAHASQPHILDTRLMELPRHQIARLLDDVAASAGALS